MIWLLISRRVFLLLLVFFSCGFYILYSFNSQLISNLNKAIRNHRLHEYGHHYRNSGLYTYRARFQSFLGLNADKEQPKYRLQGQKPARKLPNALIIGVKKCGTRALLEFIRLHPDVRAAGSEVHFFDKYYHKGYEWYRQKMPPTLDGQLTMEKTPSYWITRSAPRRVHAMNPQVKLLAVLRDPVTRALSDYAQAASKRVMAKFEELAFINSSRSVGVDASWAPVRLGVYARALRRWRRRFPSPRLLLVSGERLVADPAQEMARVQDFLGLKRVITEKHFYFNSSKGFPCLLKSESRPSPRCLGASKGRSHPQVSAAALQLLRDFYRPHNKRFYRLAGEDFGWP